MFVAYGKKPIQKLYNTKCNKNFTFKTKSSCYSDIFSKEYYHCTVDLLFDWFGISCMTTGSFCFYFQNRLIQTSQTGGQWYSDPSPFSIPRFQLHFSIRVKVRQPKHLFKGGLGPML